MTPFDEKNTPAIHVFLPPSRMQTALQTKQTLGIIGVGEDKIIRFDDVFDMWRGFCEQHGADGFYFDRYRDILITALERGDMPAWADGYFSLEAYEDPMMEAYNLEACPLGNIYVKASDVMYLFETRTDAVTDARLSAMIFGTLCASLQEADDFKYDMKEHGIKIAVSSSLPPKSADEKGANVIRPQRFQKLAP